MQLSFFGIPVLIRPSFLLMGALLAYGRSAQPILLVEWILVVLISVFVHELGHALAYRRYGHPSRIELHSMGGQTQSMGGNPLTNGQSALVSLAGPFFGFFLALLTIIVMKVATPYLPTSELAGWIFSDLLWVNIGWGVFNLLPIIPMDGGNVMRLAFRHKLRERAEVPAYVFSTMTALLCAGAAYYFNQTWLLLMTLYFAAISAMRLYDMRTEA